MLRRFLILAVLLGGLGAAPVQMVTAADSSLVAAACPPGTTPLKPVTTRVRGDGGTDTYYDVEHDGSLTDVPIPPVGFDPLGATDAQLASYGLPPRPTDTAELVSWSTDMASWKRNPDPGLCATDYRADALLRASDGTDSIVADESSYNWAGYIAERSTNTYVAVQGDFHQPSSLSTSCSGSTLASWTGFGGFYTQKLIQAGTAYLAGSSTPVAWYEYLGPNGAGINLTVMSGVTVRAGDRIHTYEVIQTSTGQTTFYVADNTTGTSKSVIKTLSVSTYYDGRTDEFIDERLTYNGSLTPLRNFGTNGWYNTKVYTKDGTWHSLGSQTEVQVNMYSEFTGYLMAYPYTMSSTTTFTDDWVRCN